MFQLCGFCFAVCPQTVQACREPSEHPSARSSSASTDFMEFFLVFRLQGFGFRVYKVLGLGPDK